MLRSAGFAVLLALRGGSADEALVLLGRDMAVEGPVPSLLGTRALVYLAKKRSDLAIKNLEEAVTAVPSAARYFHLARAHSEAGNRLAALAALRKAQALALRPGQLHALEQEAYRRLASELGQA